MKAISISITGTVQGVFFRASTKELADELRLTGWVRNTEDGAVEIFAQGAEEPINELIDWCRKGPPTAQVESVNIEEKEKEDLQDFTVRY